MLQRMVVGLDGSLPAESVLPQAFALARVLHAEVTLLRVIHLADDILGRWQRQPALLASPLRELRAEADAYLQGLEDWLRPARAAYACGVAVGDAATEIVRYAREHDADLIVLASHGGSGRRAGVFGSVAEQVVKSAPMPVLLLQPTSHPAVIAGTPVQVLAPLDGSPRAEAALPFAQTLAGRLGVPLVLLRAVETLAPPAGIGFGQDRGVQQLMASVWEEVETYLRERGDALRSNGVPVTAIVPSGPPAQEIVQYAHEHPGCLIVMATRGRTGIDGIAVGSVAQRVMQQADAPVLLIPQGQPLPA